MLMPANKGIEYRIVDRNIYFFGISVLYYNSSWNEYGMIQSNFSREEYKSDQHALDSASVKKLLLSFSNLQDKAMISLACSTGIRREDLVSIKQNDYKCEYDEQKSKYIATVTFFEQKKKRTRTIYIPSQETIQLINMHLQSCRKSQWLFPSPKVTGKFKNAHISGRHVYDILNEHLKMVKLAHRPFHSLRATAYKIAQEKGWSPRMAAELLGDSTRVAEEHYGAPSIENMKTAALDMSFD